MCENNYHLQNKKRLKAIKNGNGIQHILNAAYDVLENPLVVHDMEYKLIACTEGISTDDPIWNEIISTGTIGSDWLEFIKNECFIDDIASSNKGVLLVSDELKYDRIVGKIYNKDGLQVGFTWMIGCNKLLDDGDVELSDIVCGILSKELRKDETYTDYGQTYLESLISQLIERRIDDISLYPAHVESICFGLKEYLYLAAVDIKRCDYSHKNFEHLRDLLKRTQPDYKYAIYADYILVVMGCSANTLDVKKDLKRLYTILKKYNLHMGISSCFDNLFELQRYYNEAASALGRASNEYRKKRIRTCNVYSPARLADTSHY